MVSQLANWCRQDLGVFDAPRLLVSSDGLGKLIGQAISAELGIFAGVEVMTYDAWVDLLHNELGEPSPWRGPGLALAIMQTLSDPEYLGRYPVLAQHLDARPARLRSLSQRLSRLLRSYSRYGLETLEGWLADPDGAAADLPAELAWQPELVSRVVETLAFDPCEEQARLLDHLSESEPGPTAVVLTEPLPPSWRQLVAALSGATQVNCFELAPKHRPETVAWLEAPGQLRQAEVLRDAICHLFVDHPELEPRDVLVVVPDAAEWWPVLELAFGPVGTPEHPARSFRLQRPAAAAGAQPVLSALAQIIRLGQSRAGASQLLELLLSDPIRFRWQLPGRDELSSLVQRAGIRWGLDATHRAAHGLDNVVTNTWARGMDRLLAAIAVAPGNLGLSVGAAEGVATSELDSIGALSELVSRLRQFTQETTATSVVNWVARSQTIINSLLGMPRSEESLIQQAHSKLSHLGIQAADCELELSAADFACFVEDLATARSWRPQAGNGNLTVVAEGDLLGAGFSVVALLGATDQPRMYPADAVVGMVPEPTERDERLLSYARAARHLVVIQPSLGASGSAGHPAALARLWRNLDVIPELRSCPAAATSAAAFTDPAPSFDRAGFEVASSPQPKYSLATLRRRAALALPQAESSATLSLPELVRFLKDPAAAFLKERVGVHEFQRPAVQDQLTIAPSGLEAWAIRSRLLQVARTGGNPERAIAEEARREVLPRGPLGARVIASEVELVGQLWLAAKPDWEAPTRQLPLRVELPDAVLNATVTLRGDQLVVLTTSELKVACFEPWVQLVALAASGNPVVATIHYLHRDYGRITPRRARLYPPKDPLPVLEGLVAGARATRSRLIPCPPGPAAAFVAASALGNFDRAVWELPTSSWDSPWAWRASPWDRFYDGPASQLFEDPPRADDPPGDPEYGSFGAWAQILHRPLWEATR